MRGDGDTAIWRWNVKWWFRWLIWNVCKHGPRWDSEWIVISSYLHCALSTIILHHPTTAARYARKLLLSYLKIFIVETKPANKAWRGREVVLVVGVYLQFCSRVSGWDYTGLPRTQSSSALTDLGTAAEQWSPSPLHTTPCHRSHQAIGGGVGSERTWQKKETLFR